MEENKTNIFLKSNTLFGALMGAIFIAASVAIYKSGSPIFMNPTLDRIITLLYICGLTLQIRKYREEALGGFMSYGMALKTGLYLAAVTGFLYAIYIFFMYSQNPSLLEYYLTASEATLKQVYGESSMVESMISMLKVFTSPLSMAFSELFSKVFSGFIYTLFIAWFLKKSPVKT